MYGLLQKTYNYTTIDHGKDCESVALLLPRARLTRYIVICIGANWLHERPSEGTEQMYEGSAELVPPKHWAWYILTSDCEYSSGAGLRECQWNTYS